MPGGTDPRRVWRPRPDVVRENPSLEPLWIQTNREIEEILERLTPNGPPN
jgi:hypothetical protein